MLSPRVVDKIKQQTSINCPEGGGGPATPPLGQKAGTTRHIAQSSRICWKRDGVDRYQHRPALESSLVPVLSPPFLFGGALLVRVGVQGAVRRTGSVYSTVQVWYQQSKDRERRRNQGLHPSSGDLSFFPCLEGTGSNGVTVPLRITSTR